MTTVYCNIVTFNVNGTRIALTLDSTWKLTAGLKPNVNGAVIPYTEWDKLNDVSDAVYDGAADYVGDIEFWFNAPPPQPDDEDPAQPDVTLQNWRIVEVVIGKVGVRGDAIFNTPQVVDYHVLFADSREQFAKPRGGRLRIGLVNLGPKPDTSDEQGTDNSKDPAETGSTQATAPEMTLSELIQACLAMMGLDVDQTVPAGVDQMDAPRNLKWFGNHAPSELEKLLEMAGCVYCPTSDGGGGVQTLRTTGNAVITGGGAQLPEFQVKAIDRRGKTVIFSSFPFQNVDSNSLQGPRDDQWQFVMQDSKGQWVTPANCDLVSTIGGLLAQFKKGFADVPEKFRDQVTSQAYQYIRLGDGVTGIPTVDGKGRPIKEVPFPMPPAPQGPVLNGLINKDGTVTEIQVTATVAIKDPTSGQYQNSQNAIPIPCTFKRSDNVLQLGRPLIQVSQPSADLKTNAQELTLGQIDVLFTRSLCTQDSTDKWTPQFFHVGFQRSGSAGGGLIQLKDDEVENALSGGGNDTVCFACGEALRLRTWLGEPQNKADLIATATTWADAALAGATDPTRTLEVVGFAQCPIDGLVSEVQWDQHNCRTIITLNNWYRPLGSLTAETLRQSETAGAGGGAGPGGADYPLQHSTQETRSNLGEPGATQLNVPISPATAPVDAATSQLIRISAYDTANGYYFGHLQSRIPSPAITAPPPPGTPAPPPPPFPPFADDSDLKLSDYYQDSSQGQPDCVVMNDAESGVPIRAIAVDGTAYVNCIPSGTATDAFDLSLPMFRCGVPIGPTWAKVGAFIAGANCGFYNATIYYGGVDDESTDNLTLPQGLAAGASALLIVTEEDASVVDNVGNAPAAAQRLAMGSYVVGRFDGMSNEGTPRPKIVVRGGAGNMSGLTIFNPTATQLTSDNQLWTRSGTAELGAGSPISGPIALYAAVRAPVWDATAGNFIMFQRKMFFDARGLLYRIGAEEKTVMIGTTNCT